MRIEVTLDGVLWTKSGVPSWWRCREGTVGDPCLRSASWRTRSGLRRCSECMRSALEALARVASSPHRG